jgi:hypothetical protein
MSFAGEQPISIMGKSVRTNMSKMLRPGELLCELLDVDYETIMARIDGEAAQKAEPKASSKGAAPDGKIPVRRLPDEERRAYQAAATRRFRSRRATQRNAGEILVSADTIPLALADAAIWILKQDADGAENIRRSLAQVFHSQPGAPYTIEARIRAGQIRPWLWCEP